MIPHILLVTSKLTLAFKLILSHTLIYSVTGSQHANVNPHVTDYILANLSIVANY